MVRLKILTCYALGKFVEFLPGLNALRQRGNRFGLVPLRRQVCDQLETIHQLHGVR